MDTHNSSPVNSRQPGWWRRLVAAWEQFWFQPADPTLLGVIRICTGLVLLYTMIVYTVDLQDLLGKQGWLDLSTRQHWREQFPVPPVQLDWHLSYTPPEPKNDEERRYAGEYFRKYGAPPPAFPKTPQKALEIDEYMSEWGVDPRLTRGRGTPAWSIWFHITDPDTMMVVQLGIVLVTVCFTIGLATRLTSVLMWLAYMSTMHRLNIGLFGMDYMAVIVLLYLMIGPSGAAFSVDRLLARWWATARVDVIGRWRAFWARAGTLPAPVAPGQWSPLPTLSVSANVAIRLLQIHLCIIYMSAGLSKLYGQSWWTGEAVWGTIANFEFAPMASSLYLDFLRMIGKNRLVFMIIMTTTTLMTLAFEISYSYLIWRRATRPWLLAMAILLHGSIGLFMGLKTFSIIMLTMNLVFVSPETVRWSLRTLSWGRWGTTEKAFVPTPVVEPPKPEKTTAITPEKPTKILAGSGKRKR